ncbi:MAG: helix-turn-helix transcriptional regulator [Candidatus Aenigmatarchaeota archaeon]
MNLKKDVIIGILILSIFVFIVAISTLYVQTQISDGNACGCFIPLPVFIPFVASIGLFIGTVTYYLFHPELEKKKISKDWILDCFEGDEKSVVKKILDNDGKTLQSKLVKETTFSKVKIHRILKKLENKGFIKKSSYGNTNKVEVKDELRDILD